MLWGCEDTALMQDNAHIWHVCLYQYVSAGIDLIHCKSFVSIRLSKHHQIIPVQELFQTVASGWHALNMCLDGTYILSGWGWNSNLAGLPSSFFSSEFIRRVEQVEKQKSCCIWEMRSICSASCDFEQLVPRMNQYSAESSLFVHSTPGSWRRRLGPATRFIARPRKCTCEMDGKPSDRTSLIYIYIHHYIYNIHIQFYICIISYNYQNTSIIIHNQMFFIPGKRWQVGDLVFFFVWEVE